ncbi:MAG: hypothetical protein ACE5FC_03075, partial [Myxococcota bacterium]
MAEKTNGGSKGPRSRGGSSKSRGRKTGARSGARAGTRGGTRKRRTTGAAPTGPRKNFEPDRDARRDVLQEQLEAEFERPESFGDPLDPEEASQEDIAAELARSHDGGDDDRMEDASEEVEFGIGEGSVAALAGEEDIAAEGNAAAIDSEDAAPIIPAAGEFAEPPLMKTDDDGSPGETDEEDDAGAGAAFAGNDGAPGRERAERPAGRDDGDRLSRLWKQLSAEGGLRLSELSRRERGGRQQERWLFATGKTREGQGAAVIASPKVDSHLLIHGLRFLTELLSEKVAVKQLYLCAPFFEDDLRKAAYLVDPKKARLRLVRITPFDDERGAYRTVETLRPETRDVNRSFSDLLAEVGSARTRRLLQRFKEVAEGALFESGGEEVVCRGRKIYFRMRGEDLLVARPRDNAVLLEILFPRGRTLRLSEKSFSQTLSRIRECFETARKSQNLRSREGSFRLAVREALESREQGLTPLDTDVSVGPNRLRIDLLAARQNGAPVAVQIRTRISLEDIQQGLVAFTALREQGTLLKKVIGERGGLLNPGSDAELCFAALRTHEAGPAIADLLVPRVSFLRVSPDRRWWETPLKFDATGRAAARGAPAAEPDT